MDFKELLLEADRKHQEAAKKSQLVKRINTNFTTPAIKDEKSRRPKSEAVQKLLDEKRREERRKREAEERKKMEIEQARQEREREEKRKNTFRIPKKTATEDAPSDAESFSSISSGDEPKLSSSSTAKPETHLGVHKSSSSHGDSEKSHRSSSQSHRSSSSHRHSEKKDGHSHKTSERSSSSSHHSSKNRSGEHTSRGQGDHHSEKEKTKHHSDKYRHSSSGRHEPGSSKTLSSCEKEKSRGSFGSHSKTSEHGLHKNSRTEQKDKCVIRDKAIIVAENESSGYVTSPDISSEEEGEELPASKPSLAKNHAHNTKMKESTKSASSVQRNDSTDAAEETVVAPVVLTRHHLKPTIDRTGGSVEERAKILEKLQAIRERMAENEPGPNRKRASWGEVKKRRAKREKLDGDFTGSCMEKIDYEEEEKPSLKRPEPRPEVSTEKASKENKEKRGNKERVDKVKNSKKVVSEKHERKLDSKAPRKFNRFDEMEEKPKVKARAQPRPPPVNFSDLMKMAEQKQAQPVVIESTPKKEKERRPMTQEELDRKRAREERLKSKDYQDWYKYGNNSADKKQSKPENTESPSGGFLRPTHNVIPTESQSKPFSIPRKSDKPGCAKPDKHSTTLVTNRPSDSQRSVSHSVPTSKSKPHPTRPGMIANKPQTMAKYMNSEEKHKSSSSSSRDTSQPRPSSSSSSSRDNSQPRPSSSSRDTSQPRPSSSSSRDTSSQPRRQTSSGAPVDRTKEGNAWDRLFSRPEYKKMTEPPASKKRKMVIDSEEEDEYDDEMDDFIDDEGEEDLGSVSSMIQKMFGYDKRKYRDDDDDDRNMEVGFREVMKEEARSARLGLQEDLEDIRREQEELKQKALRKKMRK